MTNGQTRYNTALYLHLSKDDGTDSESSSIQTQKEMLTRYCRETALQSAKSTLMTAGAERTATDRVFSVCSRTLRTGKSTALSQKTCPDLGEITLKQAATRRFTSPNTTFVT